ncbi:MAG: ATP synthase F0 subunit C [Eubacteriales bacterium]|jgi:F-type H+-transporting ATPase subunit c
MKEAIYAAAAALCMAISTIAPAIAQGKVATSAMEAMARQPDIRKDIRSTLIVAMAFMETLTIYGLLIAFLIISRI